MSTTNERKPLQPEHLRGELWDMRDVQAETGYSRMTIYTKIARGDFPAPRTLGRRAIFWPASEVKAWLAVNSRPGRSKRALAARDA